MNLPYTDKNIFKEENVAERYENFLVNGLKEAKGRFGELFDRVNAKILLPDLLWKEDSPPPLIRIIDFGIGSGKFTIPHIKTLIDMGVHVQVLGFDNSDSMLRRFTENASKLLGVKWANNNGFSDNKTIEITLHNEDLNKHEEIKKEIGEFLKPKCKKNKATLNATLICFAQVWHYLEKPEEFLEKIIMMDALENSYILHYEPIRYLKLLDGNFDQTEVSLDFSSEKAQLHRIFWMHYFSIRDEISPYSMRSIKATELSLVFKWYDEKNFTKMGQYEIPPWEKKLTFDDLIELIKEPIFSSHYVGLEEEDRLKLAGEMEELFKENERSDFEREFEFGYIGHLFSMRKLDEQPLLLKIKGNEITNRESVLVAFKSEFPEFKFFSINPVYVNIFQFEGPQPFYLGASDPWADFVKELKEKGVPSISEIIVKEKIDELLIDLKSKRIIVPKEEMVKDKTKKQIKKVLELLKTKALEKIPLLEEETGVRLLCLPVFPAYLIESIYLNCIVTIIIGKEGGEKWDDSDDRKRIEQIVQTVKNEWRDLFKEEFKEVQQIFRSHSLRSAVAAIMARNMSHNIGSHVLVRNINDLKNRGEGKEADLSDYVRIRMSFIANILTCPPSWCVSEKLKKVLLPFAPTKGIRPLKKYLVASEGYYKDCCISGNSIRPIKDKTVAMPLAKTGRHALYSILENYIRNTAKHNKKSNEREIILKLSVEEDNNFPALYKITIWDNISDSGKLKEVESIINEIQKVDDNNKISLQLADEMGELLRRYWGFSEMLCCASFLRGISSKKMITPIDSPPLITPIEKIEEEGKRVGLVFYLQKAKDLLLIDNKPKLNNKEELLRFGIRIEGSSWLKENIDEAGYNFVIINDEGLDEKEQKELRELSSKLPYRTFYTSPGFEKMDKVYKKLKKIVKNKDDSNSIINLLYEEWLKKISGGEIKEILSKILFVHENASSEIQNKLKNLNIKIECNTTPRAELANQKNEEKIIFEHHGYSRRLPREACYYEAYGSGSAIDEGLKGLGGEELKKFIYKLIESALINILILDERLFDKFRGESREQKYLEAQGVTIGGDKENNYDVVLNNGGLSIGNNKNYKFISIHKGIIDKLKEELKASSDLEAMKEFVGKIRKTKRFEYIIIHSDRGEPEKLPEGVKYLDYSNLEDLVASGEEASKFELTEAILCLI